MTLSNREFEVFTLVCGGISNKAVADAIYITEKTVKFHLTNIYKKLGCKSRTEMTARFYQKNLPQDLLAKISALEQKTNGFVNTASTPPAPIETAPNSTGLPRGFAV